MLLSTVSAGAIALAAPALFAAPARAEGQCYWLQPQGQRTNRDSTSQNVGLTESVGGIVLGAQFSVAPNWFVGGGFSYEGGTFDTDSRTDGIINRYQGGRRSNIKRTPCCWRRPSPAAPPRSIRPAT